MESKRVSDMSKPVCGKDDKDTGFPATGLRIIKYCNTLHMSLFDKINTQRYFTYVYLSGGYAVLKSVKTRAPRAKGESIYMTIDTRGRHQITSHHTVRRLDKAVPEILDRLEAHGNS